MIRNGSKLSFLMTIIYFCHNYSGEFTKFIIVLQNFTVKNNIENYFVGLT